MPAANDPNWWRQACVYEIYPRSFADANGDGIGDLKGITSKVDYLARLGIDAIWLSPFYTSPLADGGYDVADYRDVDRKIGTLEDFDEMIAALKKVNIKVIVDIVPNHASNEHPWFLDAVRAGKGSKERERFIFRDGPNGEQPPNDWVSMFGGSAWEASGANDGQWYLHLFTPEQPDWNWNNPEIVEDFHKTLRFWGDRGVSGFRVDAAVVCVKDISPPYLSQKDQKALGRRVHDGDRSVPHPYVDRDGMVEVYQDWRKVFNEYNPPLMAVGELTCAPDRMALYASSRALGQVFAFNAMFADCTAKQYREVIDDQLAIVKRSGSVATWVLSSHDAVRHATRLGLPDLNLGRLAGWEEWMYMTYDRIFGKDAIPVVPEYGRRRARMATMVLMGLPGSMYLYQGEELGLPEVIDIADEDRQDPLFKRGMGKGRDGCRIPLPWTQVGPSFGFGPTAKTHLPLPKNWGQYAADVQEQAENSTLKFYQKALAIRKEIAANSDETLEWVESGDKVLHFKRGGQWHVIANLSPGEISLPKGEVLLASNAVEGRKIPEWTTVWLKV